MGTLERVRAAMTSPRELVVVDAPYGTPVIAAPSEDTTIVLEGDGGEDYICAGCWAPILQGVDDDDVRGLLFLCNDCGTVNQLPGR